LEGHSDCGDVDTVAVEACGACLDETKGSVKADGIQGGLEEYLAGTLCGNPIDSSLEESTADPLAYPIGIDEHGVNLAVLGVSESHCLSFALREINPAALQDGHLHLWGPVRQPRRHLFVRIGLRTERSDGA